MKDKPLIFAGNYKQALDFAKENGFKWTTDFIYVSDVTDIIGLRDKIMLCVGTYYERDDYGEIMAEAMIRNFRIIR